ncbi:PIN domain-containing protein [Candidatus Aerophobetes bacterium]|nr:PIN domain-containing protein [Candidatus Aerophobetes bacterium]
MSKVIVDTSVWIQFFNSPQSKEKAELDKLLNSNQVVVAGVIVSELLQGSRSQKDYGDIEDKITVLPYVEVSKDTWIEVGKTSFKLRKQGVTLPLTDILIATLAKENNLEVYTLDPHFKKIPKVKLYANA